MACWRAARARFREKPIDVIWATAGSSTCVGGGAAGAGAGAARKASSVRGFFGGGRRAGALRRTCEQCFLQDFLEQTKNYYMQNTIRCT